MRAEDVPSVFLLQEALAFQKWSKAQILAEVTLSYAVSRVAYEDQTLVGYGIFHLISDEAELLSIAVKPSRQRLGIARKIYAESIQELKSRGAESMFLEVRKKNETAQKFYQGLGFTESYRRKCYYADGEDAVIMRAML
jgi:ribosomal-protein-alanine N-acetyltransferase